MGYCNEGHACGAARQSLDARCRALRGFFSPLVLVLVKEFCTRFMCCGHRCSVRPTAVRQAIVATCGPTGLCRARALDVLGWHASFDAIRHLLKFRTKQVGLGDKEEGDSNDSVWGDASALVSAIGVRVGVTFVLNHLVEVAGADFITSWCR